VRPGPRTFSLLFVFANIGPGESRPHHAKILFYREILLIVVQMTETSSPVKHLAYVDALRGYAILMVIAVHTSEAFADLPTWLSKILNQGARGVQLFFVASALTLSMSWIARRQSAAEFYIRRFFRIAPMFWIAIVVFLWVGGTGPSIYAPEGIGFRHVAMTALFVHGFWPDTITSVVPGGWSVANEVIFYALFPLIVPPLLRARWQSLIIVAILAMVLGPQLSRLDSLAYMLPPSAEGVSGIYFSLWFPRQLPCFIFGIILYRLSFERHPISADLAKAICLLAVVLMLLFPFLEGVKYALPLGLSTSYAIAFSLFAFSLMNWPNSPLVNQFAIWTGKVSYSAYFLHFLVLHFFPTLHVTGRPVADVAVAYVMVASVTVAFSTLTYLTIEKPMIRLGSRLIASRQSATSAQLGAP
jgi:peptidoglycan/LPS O-acetylase OafA/YrhL